MGRILPGPGHIENLSIRVVPCSDESLNCDNVLLQDKNKEPLFLSYTNQNDKVLLYVDTDPLRIDQNVYKSYMTFDHNGNTLVIDRKDLIRGYPYRALFLLSSDSVIQVILCFDAQQKKYKITLDEKLIPASEQIF